MIGSSALAGHDVSDHTVHILRRHDISSAAKRKQHDNMRRIHSARLAVGAGKDLLRPDSARDRSEVLRRRMGL
jgi:hypothetical protein